MAETENKGAQTSKTSEAKPRKVNLGDAYLYKGQRYGPGETTVPAEFADRYETVLKPQEEARAEELKAANPRGVGTPPDGEGEPGDMTATEGEEGEGRKGRSAKK